MYGYPYIVTLTDGSEHLVFTSSFHENHTGVYFGQHLAETLRNTRTYIGPMPAIRQFRLEGLDEIGRFRGGLIREPPLGAPVYEPADREGAVTLH